MLVIYVWFLNATTGCIVYSRFPVNVLGKKKLQKLVKIYIVDIYLEKILKWALGCK